MMVTVRSIDSYLILAICVLAQSKPIVGILYQDIGVDVFPSTEALSLPLWNTFNQQPQTISPTSNVLSAIDQSILNANKYTAFGSGWYPYSSPSAALTELYDNSLNGYVHNGRFLKQYLVMEENLDDVAALDNFLSRFVPYVPSNYNIIPASRRPNLGFPSITSNPLNAPALQQQQPQTNRFYSVSRSATLPIQLGSGSLGVVRSPNGAVYLGSGSLGYIDDKQKVSELNEVRSRQSPQASPLTFGETPQ